jgi:hypothetical protein
VAVFELPSPLAFAPPPKALLKLSVPAALALEPHAVFVVEPPSVAPALPPAGLVTLSQVKACAGVTAALHTATSASTLAPIRRRRFVRFPKDLALC